MSTEISTYEMLEIHNVNATTAGLLKKLTEYIQQFNHMESLESLSIRKLKLIADEQTVLLENIEEVEFGNTYVVAPNDADSPAFDQRHMERTLWPEDSPLMQILGRFPEAEHVQAELDFSAMTLIGPAYGCCYFRPLLEEISKDEAPDASITYQCLEHYDCDPTIVSYRFAKNSKELTAGEPKYTEDLFAVNDIQQWYNGNFGCGIYGKSTLGTREDLQMLMQKIREFHSCFDNDEVWEIGELDESDMDTYFMISSSAVFLFQNQITDFQEYLQYFYDFAQAHHADFILCADFIPYSQSEFARLTFFAKNGKIMPKAMKY